MKRNKTLKNKRSKDVAKKTPTLYGANIVGRKHKSYVATIPANLPENIAHRAVQKGELELFLNEIGKPIEQVRTIVNNKGKEVEVSPYERDVIRALNLIVDTMIDEEQVQKAIREAPSRLRELATRPKGVELRRAGGQIPIAFDIAAFTKMIYPNVPLNGYNMKIVRNAVYSLLNKEQVFVFKNKEGTLRRKLIMPFFTTNAKDELTETIIVKGEDGKDKEVIVPIFSSIEITLSPIFLYDYNRRSYKEPINMLNLLRTIKRRSSLIDTLLDILEPERGYCVRNARQAAALERKRILDEAKALGKTIDEVELKTKLDKVKRKYLTFDKYSVINILDRVNNRSDFFKTYTSRKGEQEYLRSSAMDKLKAAAQELIDKIGIITEFYIGGKKGNETAADGALKAVFVFNENWLDEQTALMKANQKGDEKT